MKRDDRSGQDAQQRAAPSARQGTEAPDGTGRDELVQVPRRVVSDPINGKRIFAIAALLGGLGLSWWTGHDDRVEVSVRLLLTHAALEQGQATLEHQRLSGLVVRVPGEKPGDPPESRQAWDFTPGHVPKLSPLFTVKMPPDRPALEVGCAFALAPGMEPLRTWTLVEVDLAQEKVQVVDVGTCGEVETPKPRVGPAEEPR